MADGISSTTASQTVEKRSENLRHFINTTKKWSIEEMIKNAIIALGNKKGAPIFAIKKYMLGTYLYDVAKKSVYINKSLKAAVAEGRLIKSNGKGFALYKIRFVESRRACKQGMKKTVATKRS